MWFEMWLGMWRCDLECESKCDFVWISNPLLIVFFAIAEWPTHLLIKWMPWWMPIWRTLGKCNNACHNQSRGVYMLMCVLLQRSSPDYGDVGSFGHWIWCECHKVSTPYAIVPISLLICQQSYVSFSYMPAIMYQQFSYVSFSYICQQSCIRNFLCQLFTCANIHVPTFMCQYSCIIGHMYHY